MIVVSLVSSVLARAAPDHGHHPLSGRPAPHALGASGARARQLRRRASGSPEDPRSPPPCGQRARRHLRRHDLRPAPAARGPARQGAGAADDHRAEARRHRRRRRAGRRDRAVHARTVAMGTGNVREDGAGRLAARVRGLGRRELSLRPRSHRQLLDAAGAGRPLWLQGAGSGRSRLRPARRRRRAETARAAAGRPPSASTAR